VELQLRVALAQGEEAQDEAAWTALLLEELGDDLDDALFSVEHGTPEAGQKGIALGALLAKLPAAAAGRLLTALQTWAARTGRTVEASIAGDSIKLTGASRKQQDRVIEAWLARHTAGS
jgi:hypothetical protein